MLPLLSIQDLTVTFRTRGSTLTALHHISLDIHKGESIAIVGESGSGKSVLTKTFTGMLDPNGRIESGKILLHDPTLKGADPNGSVDLASLCGDAAFASIRGKRIATVFQDPMTSLDPVIPIGKQIASVILKHNACGRKEARERALEMMEKVGIPNPKERYYDYPHHYSGGMRQRVVIAIALACRPKILICDEPTTALDVTVQDQILTLIKDLQGELGFTIVFITHDLGVVARVADRVAVLYAGHLLEIGTVRDLFYDPRHPYTWALLSSLPQLSEKGKRLYAIPGTPPSLYHPITGDPFAPRNPYCLKVDTLYEPPLFRISDTHAAKTWLLDPRAPQVEKPEILTHMRETLLRAFPKERR